MSHVDDRLDKVYVHIVTHKVVYERLVDLHEIDRQLHQLFKRRIARSKIIECDHYLVVAKLLDVLDRMARILRERVLSDLNFQALGRELKLFYEFKQHIRKSRSRDILGGYIECERYRVARCIAYLTELFHRTAHNELIDIKNKVGKLGYADELQWRDFDPVGCVHADKSLKSAKTFVIYSILRLINKVEPAVSEAVLDEPFHIELALQRFLHLGIEHAELRFSRLHRIVHRNVGVLHYRVCIG